MLELELWCPSAASEGRSSGPETISLDCLAPPSSRRDSDDAVLLGCESGVQANACLEVLRPCCQPGDHPNLKELLVQMDLSRPNLSISTTRCLCVIDGEIWSQLIANGRKRHKGCYDTCFANRRRNPSPAIYLDHPRGFTLRTEYTGEVPGAFRLSFKCKMLSAPTWKLGHTSLSYFFSGEQVNFSKFLRHNVRMLLSACDPFKQIVFDPRGTQAMLTYPLENAGRALSEGNTFLFTEDKANGDLSLVDSSGLRRRPPDDTGDSLSCVLHIGAVKWKHEKFGNDISSTKSPYPLCAHVRHMESPGHRLSRVPRNQCLPTEEFAKKSRYVELRNVCCENCGLHNAWRILLTFGACSSQLHFAQDDFEIGGVPATVGEWKKLFGIHCRMIHSPIQKSLCSNCSAYLQREIRRTSGDAEHGLISNVTGNVECTLADTWFWLRYVTPNFLIWACYKTSGIKFTRTLMSKCRFMKKKITYAVLGAIFDSERRSRSSLLPAEALQAIGRDWYNVRLTLETAGRAVAAVVKAAESCRLCTLPIRMKVSYEDFRVAAFPCGHHFHYCCLRKFFNSDKNFRCPVCPTDLLPRNEERDANK